MVRSVVVRLSVRTVHHGVKESWLHCTIIIIIIIIITIITDPSGSG